MPDGPQADTPAVEDVLQELRAEQETVLMLEERLVELELAADDDGWENFAGEDATTFSRDGLRTITHKCRLMAIANPLIRRGLQLRIAYVWGQGVSIAARAAGDEAGQDVNAVVQAFLDDESNRKTLTGSQACEGHERTLGTDGNVVLAFFTNSRTGRVQARSIDVDEITKIITNPEDRDEPWFYLRQWRTHVVRAFQPVNGPTTTRSQLRTLKRLYPAMGYRPMVRPRTIRIDTDDVEVQWDAPVKHISVNWLASWSFGIGDAYTATAWATAYKDFLTDWAKLVKALSRFAWRLTSDKSSKAQSAAAKIRTAQTRPIPATLTPPGAVVSGQPAQQPVGGAAVMGPGTSLEAIPKTGATIDSESGRPLAAMAAAGLGLPVTMLLADPGVTGARATAETLDKPTENEMRMRQTLWADVFRDIFGYVIDQAVKAPLGALKGTITRDLDGREVITLSGGADGDPVDRTVDITFPDLSKVDVKTLVAAIVAADSTDKLAPLVTVRLLLEALGVGDVDEILKQMTDDQGRFIDPKVTAGQAAVDAFRRGDDPAAVVR